MTKDQEASSAARSPFDYSSKDFPALAQTLGATPRIVFPKEALEALNASLLTSEQMQRFRDVGKQLQEQVAAQLAPTIEALARLSLSDPAAFKTVESDTAYSAEMTDPACYFESTEIEISSFNELNAAIAKLFEKNRELPLAWRGQLDSAWGMHSLLFRKLMEIKDVRHPSKKHRASEPYPTEDEMIFAERLIIDQARQEWRLDDKHPLEIFARLQHFGAPTRLIDVTRNPYIAAWFAVAEVDGRDDRDGRLLALATHPILRADESETGEDPSRLTLDAAGSTPYPFWHYLDGSTGRQQVEWGTGALRRFWVPPAYEQRILAQNAAFVVDGVPMTSPRTAPYFKKPNESSQYWKKADLLASSSIYTKLYHPNRKVQSNMRKFAPTFTFRIKASAKRDIRRVLEERFSYTHATLFPDIEGLAQYLSQQMPSLLAERQ